jgi:hypothetical protein
MASSKARRVPAMPTTEELARARILFEEYEPRDLFYRIATELIALALDGKTSITVAEALAALLQTWNAQFYRFHASFDSAHFAAIEGLLMRFGEELKSFRLRSIESFADSDAETVGTVFTAFENVLGPVGAAKALHLIAPAFFPLWDRKIAAAYGTALDSIGFNTPQYLRFMEIAYGQVKQLGVTLKRIDEYNYCRFTQGWSLQNAAGAP